MISKPRTPIAERPSSVGGGEPENLEGRGTPATPQRSAKELGCETRPHPVLSASMQLRLVPPALLSLTALSACLWQGENIDLSGVDTRLTILHTSDIHSRLFPFDLAPNAGDRSLGLDQANAPFGGAARLAYVLRRERKRSSRVVHLDSGDCFQGAPIFNINMGEAELRFQTMVGLDAAVIGNHEFDAGVDNLTQQLFSWARYDNLAANYILPDPTDPNKHDLAALTQPFTLYNLKGLRLAVIGMANLGSLTSIGEGGNSLNITPMEQNDTVRHWVNFLHDSVDLIVVLTHLGLSEDQELIRGYEKAVATDRVHADWEIIEDLGDGISMVHVPGVRGIDLVVGGHLHIVLNPPKQVKDPDGRSVPIMHSGAFAKFVGRMDLVVRDDPEFGGKRIVAQKYQVFPIDDRLRQFEDPQIKEMLQPYLLELNRALDLKKVMGYAPKTITRFSARGNGDSGLGNLVAESMRSRHRVDAELAVTNTLGVRDNFYAGPITLEDMFNVFPFENTLTIMYLSGTEIQELVDFITTRSASRGCNAQAQVAGLRFTMNCGQVLENQRTGDSKSPGEDISINGIALRANATYKVATNDYIAKGGSGFRVLKRNTTQQDTGVSLRDALGDYLISLPTCGEHERDQARWCDKTDELSVHLCHDTGLGGRIPGDSSAQGAYANVPCVLGVEDGRILRKLTADLDSLPDFRDEEVPP